MATIQRVDDEEAAADLAKLLNGNTRRRPVVVVTIPAARTEPWIDVEEIAREAGTLADVYLMPTGDLTWSFTDKMAEGTQVYGGAGRVYPVGHEWATNLAKSPLRFAFNEHGGEIATRNLTSDMLRMAAAAGLLRSLPTSMLRQVRGVVSATIAGRALVDVGNTLPASIAQELTVDGVDIDRIVTPGQHVAGWYDAETNRVDVTKALRAPSEALAAYQVGDVVLAKVAMVRNGKAELMLFPRTNVPEVLVAVLRVDVTTNPTDDLRTLMTVGEVVTARVTGVGPRWGLRLSDIDDGEPVVPAPALLPDGPPWLVEEALHEEDVRPAPSTSPLLPAPTLQAPVARELGLRPPVTTAGAPAAPPVVRPTPALFRRNRVRPGHGIIGMAKQAAAPAPPVPAAGAPVRSESTKALLLKIDGLAADVARLTREKAEAEAQLAASAAESSQLSFLLDQEQRRANGLDNSLTAARTRLRRASRGKPDVQQDVGPRFADREQGFRYLVLTAWATRTLPGEQGARPLRDYMIGPRFLDSLASLEGVAPEKVADVVFEIVTGVAQLMPGREVHQMRSGSGGGDPVRRRGDGSVCWRASLQVNTPSARRIHYWVHPTGMVELARVGTHDDFDV